MKNLNSINALKVVFFLSLLTFLSCNKKEVEISGSRVDLIDIAKLKHVSQAMIYNLQSEKCKKIGRKLLKIESNSVTQTAERGGAYDSLSMDSTIWVLEAALNCNWDYDNPIWDTTSFVALDSHTFCIAIPISNSPLNCAFDDVQQVYDSVNTNIDNFLGSDKYVHSINVEGYTNDPNSGTAYIYIDVLPVSSSDNWHPCWCYTYGATIDKEQLITNNTGNCNCTTNNINAGQEFIRLLNCYVNPCRPNSSVWTNITNFQPFPVGANPTLYSTGYFSCQNWCSNPTVNQMDCMTLINLKPFYEAVANAAIPTSPANMTVRYKTINSVVSTSGANYGAEWDLWVSYGTRVCAQPNVMQVWFSN